MFVAILPSIVTKTYKEKIYVGHEALRVTRQFKEKRRKVELKPEQVRIPKVTVRASKRSSTDMRSIKLEPLFSGSGFRFPLSVLSGFCPECYSLIWAI